MNILEMAIKCRQKDKEIVKAFLREAIQKVNTVMKFTVPIDCDTKEGYNYAEVH